MLVVEISCGLFVHVHDPRFNKIKLISENMISDFLQTEQITI